jgi:hypothetical protein
LNIFAEDYWSLEAEGEYEKLLEDMLGTENPEGEYEKLLEDMLGTENPEGRHIRRSSYLAMLES